MLNIITFDGNDWEEYRKYLGNGFVNLEHTETIEKEFFNLFNQMLWKEDEGLWEGDRPRFDSDFDITIMKEIDHAQRCDMLVVKTPNDRVLNVIGVRETIDKLNDIVIQTEIEVTERCPRKCT